MCIILKLPSLQCFFRFQINFNFLFLDLAVTLFTLRITWFCITIPTFCAGSPSSTSVWRACTSARVEASNFDMKKEAFIRILLNRPQLTKQSTETSQDPLQNKEDFLNLVCTWLFSSASAKLFTSVATNSEETSPKLLNCFVNSLQAAKRKQQLAVTTQTISTHSAGFRLCQISLGFFESIQRLFESIQRLSQGVHLASQVKASSRWISLMLQKVKLLGFAARFGSRGTPVWYIVPFGLGRGLQSIFSIM